jgi:preprotein translocase subunit SecE
VPVQSKITYIWVKIKQNAFGNKYLKMSKIVSYIENAYDELIHKVSWPTWKELQETTGIVLTAIAILTLIVFLMDGTLEFLFSKVIYGLLK